MKIGLIIYSNTGHTLEAAEKIRDALNAAGHTATVERITVTGDDPTKGGAPLANKPEPAPYDALVLASPVWAFHLPDVTSRYMWQIPPVKGKKAACFVTQSFGWAALGGTHSVNQLAKAASGKGASVVAKGVVGWNRKDRASQIDRLAQQIVKAFQ